MADRFHLDPENARRTVARARTTAEDLRAAFERHRAALARDAGCWGDDDIGKSFATSYVPAADEAVTYTDSYTEHLGTWADGTGQAIDGFCDLDADNARRVDEIDHEYADQLEHPPS